MNKSVVVGLAALVMVLTPALVTAMGSGARTRVVQPPTGAIAPTSVTTGPVSAQTVHADGGYFQGLNAGPISTNATIVLTSAAATNTGLTLGSVDPYIYASGVNSTVTFTSEMSAINASDQCDTAFMRMQPQNVLDSEDVLLAVCTSAGGKALMIEQSGLIYNDKYAPGTAGSGTGITANYTGTIVNRVHKITVAETALTDADGSEDETIWTLPAKARLVRVIADVTATFTGGGLSDVDVTCGTAGSTNLYLAACDIDTATNTCGDVAAEIGTGLLSATVADVPSFSGTTALVCRFTCAGANCADATAGSITFYIEHLVYP